MLSIDVTDREIGDLDEFERQIRICERLGLSIVGPVYKSWEPLTAIRPSRNLKSVSSLTLLNEIIPFINLHGVVTVRQIYYHLVSKQLIWNNKHEYQRVVRIVKNARLAGLIDFNSVTDDTREAEKTLSWNSIEEILEAAIEHYRSDWWIDQPYYVEVWLEKRALRRIFHPITDAYDVHLCVGGGYQSWSEIWEAKERFEQHGDKEIIILYFGDLDPSGKDIPRDIKERFDQLKIPVTVKEIALTREDVERYNLPRNPNKRDTRNRWYIQKYGINYGVELDALEPEILREKIKKAILDHVDLEKLKEKKRQDEEERERWRHIIHYMKYG